MARRDAIYRGRVRIDHLANHPRPTTGTHPASRANSRRRVRRRRQRACSWRLARRLAAGCALTALLLLAVGYRSTLWQDGHALYRNSHRAHLIEATTTAAEFEADLDTILDTSTLDDPDSLRAGFNNAEGLLSDLQDWSPPVEFRAYRIAMTATVDATVAWLDYLVEQTDTAIGPVVDDPALAAAVAQQRDTTRSVLQTVLDANDLADTFSR